MSRLHALKLMRLPSAYIPYLFLFMLQTFSTANCTSHIDSRKPVFARPNTHQECYIDLFHSCPNESHNALSCWDVNFRMSGKTSMELDAECYVSRPAKYWSKVQGNITKCRDTVSFNTCEHFQTLTFQKDGCNLATKPNMPWSIIIHSIKPPVGCPFAAGNRSVHGANVDVASLAKQPFPFDGSFWILRVKNFDENGLMHMCFDIGFHFQRVKQ